MEALLLNLLSSVLPSLVAIVLGVVLSPTMGFIKNYAGFIANRGPTFKRITVGIVAIGMTELSELLNIVLPTDLAVIGESEIAAAISAGVALAIHAGNKARQNN